MTEFVDTLSSGQVSIFYRSNLRDDIVRIGHTPDSLPRLVFCVFGADVRLASLRARASYAVVLADVHARSKLHCCVLQGREANGILRHLCRRICLHQQTYDLHVAVSEGEMEWCFVLLVFSVGACFAFEQVLDDPRLWSDVHSVTSWSVVSTCRPWERKSAITPTCPCLTAPSASVFALLYQ